MPRLNLPHPLTHCGDLTNPPAALSPLCLRDQWVAWKWQRGKNGAWTKPPFRSDSPNQLAANNDPQSWGTYQSAVAAVSAGRADGVGFVLTGLNIGAIDLDHCRNSVTGKIDAWPRDYPAPGKPRVRPLASCKAFMKAG
jgi:hypothetical protein